MTTFGQTSPGTDFDNLTGDYTQVSQFTLGSTLTFTKMFMYMDGNGVGSGDQPCKTLIYSTSGALPGAVMAISNEVTIIDGQAAGWVEFTLTAPVELTAAQYWLGFIAGQPSNAARRGYTSVASSRKYEPDTYSDGPLDPWTDVGAGTDSLQISVYAETGAATQTLLPSADSVDGAWTDQAGGTTLYAAIDEATFSDADYIRSELNPSASGCRIKLAAGGDPHVSTNHVVHWRTGKIGSATINMTVKLYQGGGDSLGAGTLIASFARNGVGALTTYDETLSGAEADSITDYTDLYLEFFADTA